MKSRGVSDEGQKVALMLHTGGMALQEVFYSLVDQDADLSLAESIKVLDEILSQRLISLSNGICFVSLNSKLTKQLTNLYVGCDRNRCHAPLRKLMRQLWINRLKNAVMHDHVNSLKRRVMQNLKKPGGLWRNMWYHHSRQR